MPAFTIYIDSPPASPPKAPAATSARPTPLLRSRSASYTNAPAALACPDKENTHPVTGERASSAGPGGKGQKRKTSVLETKHYAPPAAKKLKEGLQPPAKPRRAASVPLLDLTAPDAPEQPKKKKVAGTKRAASSRKVASLPSVAEERDTTTTTLTVDTAAAAAADASSSSELPLSQTEIDSRVYDLTVSPLADVSEAYEAVPVEEPAPTTRKSKAKALQSLGKGLPAGRPRMFARSQSLPATFLASLVAADEEAALFASGSGLTLAGSSTFGSEDTLAEFCISPIAEKDETETFIDIGPLAANTFLLDTPERTRARSPLASAAGPFSWGVSLAPATFAGV